MLEITQQQRKNIGIDLAAIAMNAPYRVLLKAQAYAGLLSTDSIKRIPEVIKFIRDNQNLISAYQYVDYFPQINDEELAKISREENGVKQI